MKPNTRTGLRFLALAAILYGGALGDGGHLWTPIALYVTGIALFLWSLD